MSRFPAVACAALLFSLAMAERFEVGLHGMSRNQGEAATQVTVCDDDAIWDQIMSSSDVDTIRSIPWKAINTSMASYLSYEETIMSSIEASIQVLKAAIAEKSAAGASQKLSDAQVQELITGSVSAVGGYGSVKTAKDSACGKPGQNRPRVPDDSMDVAVTSIVALAKPLLSTAEFKSSKNNFLRVCKEFLNAGDDDVANYCGQLCAQLADVVQGMSDQHSNSLKSTAKLAKELDAQTLKLLQSQERWAHCEESRKSIDTFRLYLDSLDKAITERHAVVRKAERDLVNAEWALDNLQRELVAQQQLIAKAADLLTGKQATVQSARETLASAQTDEQTFTDQLGDIKDQLALLQEELQNMRKAADAVLEIKKYVSATALKMEHFVDVAVREPVRNIGLQEETNVWDYFSKTVNKEKCATDFREQLSDFHGYCTGPAMSAFEAVKDYVDLTPLCTMDPEEIVGQGTETQVQTLITHLTEDLQGVLTWLDPFKGVTRMDKTHEEALVEQGEPAGLRRVMGVYGTIKFYTKYLKEWKVGKGIFLKLLSQLTKKIELLEDEIKKADNLLAQVDSALKGATKLREEAKAKLDVALADETVALTGKQELEKAKAIVEAQIQQAQNSLKDLEDALKLAIQQYKEARAFLVSEFDEKKNGIQSLSQIKMNALDN